MPFVNKPCDHVRHLYSYGHGNHFVIDIGPDSTSEVLQLITVSLSIVHYMDVH